MQRSTRCSRRPGRRPVSTTPRWQGRAADPVAPPISKSAADRSRPRVSSTRASRSRCRARSGRSSTSCPRVISAAEWATIESGVIQRVKALEASWPTCTDRAKILATGSSLEARDHRAATSTARRTASSHPTGCACTSPESTWSRCRRAGSGSSRTTSARRQASRTSSRTARAMTHVFPELFASHRVRQVSGYPARLLEALRASAPAGVNEPTVVVLTPASTTRRTSSTHSWPGAWASSSSSACLIVKRWHSAVSRGPTLCAS